MESLYLFILLFFIIALVVPIFLNIKFSVNLKDKKGIVSLFVFGIKISLISFESRNQNLIFKRKKKTEDVEFEFSEKQMIFAKQFLNQIKDKLQVYKIQTFSKIGMGDALNTSIMNGWINLVVNNAYMYINNIKPHATCNLIAFPSFNSNNFIISVCSKISISIYDLIYGAILALLIIKRRSNERI